MKIFVLHYSKLVERKRFLLEQFRKHNITEFEFIEDYDKDELTKEDLELFDPALEKSKISLFLKHFLVYDEVAEKYERALIFEDDVILCENFVELFAEYMRELPADFDMLFLGDGCNLHISDDQLILGKHIYAKGLEATEWGGFGATRCSDSYVISNTCAAKLIKFIHTDKYKMGYNIDIWLNRAARENKFQVYWAEPTIVTQGSQNGLFPTTLG